MDDPGSILWFLFGALALGVSCFATMAEEALIRFSPSRLDELLKRFANGNKEALSKILAVRISDHENMASAWRAFSLIAKLTCAGWYWLTWQKYLQTQTLQSVTGSSILFVSLVIFYIIVEGIPRAAAQHGAERFVWKVSFLLWLVSCVAFPLVWIDKTLEHVFDIIYGRDATDEEEEAEDEILALVADTEREGGIAEDAREMIESIIEFKDCPVREIMTPRTDMICVRSDVSLVEALRISTMHGFSRIPIYEETRDNITGILHIKDVLPYWNGTSNALGGDPGEMTLTRFLRKPELVPESKPIHSLLGDFRIGGLHLAIVVDEYGGTSGLVTIEDIIEEIIGEIQDEYDKEESLFVKISDNCIEVDAKIPLDDLNEELSSNFPEEEDFNTLGGFIVSALGHIPFPGEKLNFENLTLNILEADERRIRRVRITII